MAQYTTFYHAVESNPPPYNDWTAFRLWFITLSEDLSMTQFYYALCRTIRRLKPDDPARADHMDHIDNRKVESLVRRLLREKRLVLMRRPLKFLSLKMTPALQPDSSDLERARQQILAQANVASTMTAIKHCFNPGRLVDNKDQEEEEEEEEGFPEYRRRTQRVFKMCFERIEELVHGLVEENYIAPLY